MSRYETFMARDGHRFGAYIAKPAGKARGGSLIVQELSGLTPFIRAVADDWAAEGYLAIAPALFDRIKRNLVLGYSPQELEQGLGVALQVPTATALLDVAAAAAVLRHVGKVAVIGFCWGGRLAWAAASELSFGAAVCYCGTGIAQELPKTPKCPTMLHFGAEDRTIAPGDIERIRAAFPAGVYHLYAAAGHAFSNDDRPENYQAEAAVLARGRSIGFVAQHVG
jgi:carboxymethylenebutenolidase